VVNVTDENPEFPDILEKLMKLGVVVTQCGSRVTCCPAPTESDFDYLVVVPYVGSLRQQRITMDLSVILADYSLDGGDHYQNLVANTFCSWRSRNGMINLIVTSNQEFAAKHKLATAVCKRLNLMDKKHRILLFQAILYGKLWEKYDEGK
jgi:hypothetical protein